MHAGIDSTAILHVGLWHSAELWRTSFLVSELVGVLSAYLLTAAGVTVVCHCHLTIWLNLVFTVSASAGLLQR